jgi:hypothetical protein
MLKWETSVNFKELSWSTDWVGLLLVPRVFEATAAAPCDETAWYRVFLRERSVHVAAASDGEFYWESDLSGIRESESDVL